ncbi:hypothetical protein FKG94_00350 [Exilibacterium tricleocarpae]|uniref:ClpX-type ZB domain-containing protein n=1 Tax=Exilibacterium tricleocarpae TaxID=2591008 RepID=A0A545U9A5_9GAMM|nr:ClpX C4-type zinc finger protein [Exilibacterium tricleocarpae]TQV86045.1 hypothetical protein FKG94_00350 [Exilibacterium tricleocarpae]
MLTCSFCGSKADTVAALLAGPNVNICDQCIRIGERVIKTRDALEQPPPGLAQWAKTDNEVLLCEIAATSELVDTMRDTLQTQILELRRRGIGWTVIGTALGVSHQVAQERFG